MIARFKEKSPEVAPALEEAAGYAVFPTLTQVTIGLQLGGQKFPFKPIAPK